MIKSTINPFEITKATDFSDQEIEDYWVDIHEEDGFRKMVKPKSPVPMLILGGKGSGKTHTMRYFSYSLHKIRYSQDVISGISKEGYIGVYFRCGDLNAGRFNGKGQTEDVWLGIFAYFIELWLAQLVLEMYLDIFDTQEEFIKNEVFICEEILNLFDATDFTHPKTIKDLIKLICDLQKKINIDVNNCAITKKITTKILVTYGKLSFGIPKILSENIPSLKDIIFLYLIDEFENLDELHQKHINTLLREKKLPCTLKIGSRLYGIKTYSTFSANEDNKEGSEYEKLHLDAYLRNRKAEYKKFIHLLCRKRLTETNYNHGQEIEAFFEEAPQSFFENDLIKIFNLQDTPSTERPYFKKLQGKLKDSLQKNLAIGVKNEDEIKEIINNLSTNFPFLEKVNTFLLYKDWHAQNNLLEASKNIKLEAQKYIKNPNSASRIKEQLNHFKDDLIAQMLREFEQKQIYLGVNTFIDISDGLPRNFLIILKHIFKWSTFNGENPFLLGKISKKSQQQGINQVSEWFYHSDTQITGIEGEEVKDSINRLATLFREIRFSDKPSECSLSTFSFNSSEVSTKAKRIVELATNWSLLIKIERGQRDRNSMRVDAKYQINGMLAPYWDLPVSRRGTIALTPNEINAIFDPSHSKQFPSILKNRTKRMNAPFFSKKSKNTTYSTQILLPGLEND